MFEEDVEQNVLKIRQMLRERQESVATAESCTAGLVAYGLTSVAGSSDYFKQSWVLYAEDAKRFDFLMPLDIEVYSMKCARWLAKTSREKARTNHGIGVTGLATTDNGRVWFAVNINGEELFAMRLYAGDRNTIRRHAAADIIEFYKTTLHLNPKTE